MGRKLEFDRDKALTKATELFWKRGYVNTSLAQLLKAMKLGEGSFYNTFKGKRHLYLECLQHYNRTFMARRSAALSSERPAVERITEFFDVVIEDLASNKAPGCMVSNSINNEVLSERELRSYLFGGFQRMLAFIAGIVAQGQSRGEVTASLRPEVAARILFTYLHGLHRLSVYELEPEARREETHAFVEAMLRPSNTGTL